MSVPPNDVISPPPAPTGTPSAEEKQWAMFAHLSALIGYIIPFGSIIGPLIIWQIKKNEMPFVDDQGKEALNFQITVAIAAVICFCLIFVLIGILLLPILAISALVFIIIAAIAANNGQAYRYPVCLRLIK
jgi:uncharacterized protein